MTIETFPPVELDTNWKLITQGSAHSFVGVQVANQPQAIDLAIAATMPAANSGSFLQLSGGGDLSFSTELQTDTKLYARSSRGNSILRGYWKTA